MTQITLVLKNLTRNRLRTALTVSAIALPLFVFTIARSFVDLVSAMLAESDRNMRVAVHQKLTYTAQLPQRIRGEIEALDTEGYLTAVCRATWFGGRVEGTQGAVPSMAVDRDTFPVVYSEYQMTPEELEGFRSERRAAIVGKQLADRMNLTVGDRITLVGSVPPFATIEFIIKSIPEGLDGPWLYFGLDYYEEAYKQAGLTTIGVNNFWIKCASPQARTWALAEIDKHFANSEHETRTEMESTFFASFAQAGGDWVGMIWTVGRLVVIVAIAVALNTMSMSFRERTREIAAMRALGFPAGRVVGMVLCEGALLGLIGGALAVLPLWGIVTALEPQLPMMAGPIVIPGTTVAMAMAVAVCCGLLAAVVPATLAARLQVASALRKVV